MPSIPKIKLSKEELTQRLDAALPQTQCGLCGYGGCSPYAEAMATGEATPDLCPPGGIVTLQALCDILSVENSSFEEKVRSQYKSPQVAFIQEDQCIGCTKCIQACPVDAIIGTNKMMHTIIKEECTGCELCVEPCPVDCIELNTIAESTYNPDKARKRHHAREDRLQKSKQQSKKQYHEKLLNHDKAAKQNYIAEAISRANKRRKNNHNHIKLNEDHEAHHG